MFERQVYVNGEFVPESRATISVFDRALRLGDSVYDVTRTFNHRLFKPRMHLERLYRSLGYMGIESGLSLEEMDALTLEVLERNRPALAEGDDCRIVHIITRGLDAPAGSAIAHRGPNLIVFTAPIPFASFARFYETGVPLVVPSMRRIPPASLSPKAKVASRAVSVLAELEARALDPDAYPLLLDLDGFITESTSSGFLFVQAGRLCLPREERVLPSVSVETLIEIAGRLGIPVAQGDWTLFEALQADEAFLAATSFCALPVRSINGRPLGGRCPGRITSRLLDAWTEVVGVDPRVQARRVAAVAERG